MLPSPAQVLPPADHWGNPWSPGPGDQREMETGPWVPGNQVPRSWVTIPVCSREQSQWPCRPESSTGNFARFESLANGLYWPHPGREADLLCWPTAVHSSKSHWSRKPGQGKQAAMEPVFQPCSGREASSPVQLSSVASGPALPGSLNRDPGQPGSPACSPA